MISKQMADLDSTEEEIESYLSPFEAGTEAYCKNIDSIKAEILLLRKDYLLLRLVVLLGLAFCIAAFFLQISLTDTRSYRILQELIDDSKEVSYSSNIYYEGEFWIWDAEQETLKVNTSIFVR